MNETSPTIIVAAITKKIPKKEYPFNVHLPANSPLPQKGTILCNQLMTVSKKRLGDNRGHIGPLLMQQLDQALKASLGL